MNYFKNFQYSNLKHCKIVTFKIFEINIMQHPADKSPHSDIFQGGDFTNSHHGIKHEKCYLIIKLKDPLI